MYSVVTYVSNSVLNYNLNYNSLIVVPRLLQARGFVTKLFCTETCWVHCNTKSLAHQGCSWWFVLADSRADLAGSVIFHTNSVSTQVHF